VFFYPSRGILLYMFCPVCRHKETRVVDSRVAAEGMAIRRRRECEKCQYRFSTSEEVELLDIVVVKNDGRRETYSREKMVRGIRQSLVKRPMTQERLERLVHAVERDIQKKKSGEVTSRDIGEIVMRHLAKCDQVAYIRFASIYRAFTDARRFASEVRSLQKSKKGDDE
jgi:transcriptional repressor NrdR